MAPNYFVLSVAVLFLFNASLVLNTEKSPLCLISESLGLVCLSIAVYYSIDSTELFISKAVGFSALSIVLPIVVYQVSPKTNRKV